LFGLATLTPPACPQNTIMSGRVGAAGNSATADVRRIDARVSDTYVGGMSAITLTVRDETTAGDALAELELQIDSEQVTVAELIRARVHQEVRAHNATAASSRSAFVGLVQPSDTERALNARARGRGRRVDADAQTAVALRAFERGHILLLVDDRQVQDSEQTVTLRQGSSVTFLKLVPLVGG
jgi:hypothetical protein